LKNKNIINETKGTKSKSILYSNALKLTNKVRIKTDKKKTILNINLIIGKNIKDNEQKINKNKK